MKTMRYAISLILVASVAVSAAGCAQDLDDINRVQNNVTQKSELKGEFYFRSTVIEAPYASFGFFVGNQNYHMERGVFDIQENYLYFYRTYEHAIGGETLGASADLDTPLYETNADGSIKMDEHNKPVPVMYQRRIGDEIVTVQRFVYRGSPLLAVPITSHFDIKREYNALTGEETNVIVENTADREWWERQYMRVSWGTSHATHTDDNLIVEGSLTEVIDEEFSSDDAPTKVYNAEGTLDYFDFQVRKTAMAPVLPYAGEGFDYIPACWYYPWYLGQIVECQSERVTFRQSFMRVKPSDYVAWDYDDELLKQFGYYRIERANYDALRGVSYSGVTRRIRRFRIWENYVVDKGAACEAPGGNVHVGCGAGEVCEPVGDEGLFCVAEDPNDRLDYSQMTPKPIVWYLSEEFPRELVPETVMLAEHWDVPFTDVVTERKGAAPGHEMFVLCENSLEEAGAALAALQTPLDINNPDHVAQAQAEGMLASIAAPCMDMDQPKRNGDLRYSQIHSVNPPTSVGLYGYGPSSADPMTGELLSANSYMYTPAMKRGANMAMLTIELLTGVRNFWETVYANHVKEHGNRKVLGQVTGGAPPSYTVAEAQAVARTLLAPNVAERLSVMGLEKTDQNHAAQRMAMLPQANPALAKTFVTDDVRLLLRDPSVGTVTTESTESQLERLGMHKWGHFGGNYGKQLERWEESARGGCKFYAEFADNAIIGLAREYAHDVNEHVCDAARNEAGTVFDFDVFEELQGTCDTAGAEHTNGLWRCAEVETDDQGTKGLFWTNPCTVGKLKAQLAVAIFDLEQMNEYYLNNDYYPADPVYTDTKHEVLQVSQLVLLDSIEEIRAALITRLWKRIYLGVAEHEVGHSIGLRHNFEGSTDAMNFGQKYWNIKGDYDNAGHFHAADFLSGETTAQSRGSMRQMQSSSVMDYSAKFNDRFEGVGYYDRAAVRFGYGGLVEVFNQTPSVDKFMGYIEDPADSDPTNAATVHDFAHSPLELMFKRVHYTKIPELFANTEAIHDRSYVSHTQVQEDGKTTDGKWAVPYRFCSDELAGRIPTCERWDSGVDSFEITRNTLADYEQYWPLWGNWHDSNLFFPDNYASRIARMFGQVKMHMQWWTMEYTRFNHDGWWEKRFGVPWHEDPMAGLAGSVAVADGANTMAATFGRPTPGTHGYRGSRNVFEPVPWLDNSLYTNTMLISPLNCEARQLYPSWDYSGYLPLATKAGAIYERLAAYEALADPTTHFMAVDTQTDVRRYQVSYYQLFPKQLMNLFSGMLANQTDRWGWYMTLDENGAPDACHRRVLVGPEAGEPVDAPNGFWAFNPEPEYTFPTTRFRVPMLAAYYGLGLFIDSYDSSFVDITRVYVDGHQSAIQPSDDAIVTSFTDPLSGKTYTAVQSKFAEDLYSPSAAMITKLQEEFNKYSSLADLQDKYNYSEYQFILDKLELLRGMNYVYDYGNE